eukprot:1978616-Pyramimonas_sp.AAC.1
MGRLQDSLASISFNAEDPLSPDSLVVLLPPCCSQLDPLVPITSPSATSSLPSLHHCHTTSAVEPPPSAWREEWGTEEDDVISRTRGGAALFWPLRTQ